MLHHFSLKALILDLDVVLSMRVTLPHSHVVLPKNLSGMLSAGFAVLHILIVTSGWVNRLQYCNVWAVVNTNRPWSIAVPLFCGECILSLDIPVLNWMSFRRCIQLQLLLGSTAAIPVQQSPVWCCSTLMVVFDFHCKFLASTLPRRKPPVGLLRTDETLLYNL